MEKGGRQCLPTTYLEVALFVEHGHVLHTLIVSLGTAGCPNDLVEQLNVVERVSNHVGSISVRVNGFLVECSLTRVWCF